MPILALDSVDGGGKTTCSRLLFDYLSIDKSINVRHVVMPGATALGQELRRVLKSESFSPAPITERLLFAADTIQFEFEYKPFLDSGGWLVCDRFSRITDLIYGSASGLDPVYLATLQNSIGEKLMADIFFVFQLPLEIALTRKENRSGTTIKDRCRIEEKGKIFLSKVNDAYCDLTKKGAASPCSTLQLLIEQRCHQIVPVNASRTAKEVFDEIKVYVDRLMEEKK